MRSRRLALILVLLVGVPALVSAAPITIGFDALADSEMVTSQFPGLTFSGTVALAAGISLNEFEFPPRSLFNVASDFGGAIVIDFAAPVSYVGGYFTYIVPLTIAAFDAGSILVDSATSLFSENYVSSGNPPNEYLQLSGAGITRVVLTGDALGGSFTLDDLEYTPACGGSTIPEPGTLSLLTLGAAALSLKRRRGN